MKLIAIACLALGAVFSFTNVQDEMPEMETPGEHHKHLEMMAGEWDSEIKFLMDPENPMEWKGTESAKIKMGGFWLISKSEGDFMGQKFEGLGMTGYDQHKKKYVGTWADSMGSYMMISEGSCSKDGKVNTMIGTVYDPMQKKNVTWKQVTKIVDKNKKTFKMYTVGKDKKETLAMEATLTRKKKKEGR